MTEGCTSNHKKGNLMQMIGALKQGAINYNTSESEEHARLEKRILELEQTLRIVNGYNRVLEAQSGQIKQASTEDKTPSWAANYMDKMGIYYERQDEVSGSSTNRIYSASRKKLDKPAWAENYLDLMESRV